MSDINPSSLDASQPARAKITGTGTALDGTYATVVVTIDPVAGSLISPIPTTVQVNDGAGNTLLTASHPGTVNPGILVSTADHVGIADGADNTKVMHVSAAGNAQTDAHTNAQRNTGATHRSLIAAVDKLPTAILTGSLTQTATTGGSLASGTTYFWAVIPSNKYGTAGVPSSGTYIGTGTPGASNTAIILAFAAQSVTINAQTGTAEYYDVFLSTDAAPKFVGRITETQRAAGIIITTASTGSAACVTSAGTAGSVQINVVGTQAQTSAAQFAQNNAYVPDCVAAGTNVPIACADYAYAFIKVDVSVNDLASAPTLVLAPFTKNQVDTFYEQGQLISVPLLTALGQTLRQDYVLQLNGATSLVVLVSSISGNGAKCTCVVELA